MKAVIMAGGEGTRLRPLTCDMPKPMAPLCGRPVMDYTLELLARHGFGEAAVTLMYMPQAISEHFGDEAHGVKLRYFVEDEPLGTAGSVKRASADFGGDFLVISGDGLCDFDLGKIWEYHKAKGGAATIVLKGMPNPLEYGLVMTDADGRVTRFLEKPDWAQALTDLVNTGVYVLSTEAMRLVPEGKPFDFGKELFPLMLEKGMPVYGYTENGYWLDIGDIATYVSAQFDLLDGRVKFGVAKPPRREGVKPPVLIGENVSIAPGASVGEYAVIGDGCRIAAGASIRNSVVGAGSYIGKRAALRGALVCGGCVVKADAAMYDGSVLGAGSVLSEGSVVSPNVRIWPGKRIEPNSGVYSDVVKGVSGGGLIENGLIAGTIGADITPEYAARIGAAAATALKGGSVAVSCDGSEGGGVIKSALAAGLLGSGAEAVDMGVLPLNVFSFGVADREVNLGLAVTETGIAVRDGLGLPPARELARKLESAYRRGEFSRAGCREAKTDSAVFSDYARELEKYRAPFPVTVSSPEQAFGRLFSSVFTVGGSVRARISADGSSASLVDEEGEEITPSRLLYGICFMLAVGGVKRVPLPPETPKTLADAIRQLGCEPRIRMACPPDKSDDASRREAARLRVLDDAVFGCAFLLKSLADRKQRAADFFASVPDFAVAEFSEECGGRNGGLLIRLLGEREAGFTASAEGIDLRRGGAVCTVKPSDRGRKLRLVAEANTVEAARELGAEVIGRIREIKKELDNTPSG